MTNMIATSQQELPVLDPLTEEERSEILAEMAHYPEPQAATIEALKIVQKHQRWVSDGKLLAIADLLNASPEAVEGVATFYNKIYRRPVAETVFAICNSVSCWSKGSDEVLNYACEKLQVQLGEASANNKITLLPTPCLGACDKAPTMMVGEELVTHVNSTILDHFINEYK
jgi:NADH-quinone oxidoreductase subunit E